MSRLQVRLNVSKESPAFGAVTDRTLAVLRLLLSVSALLIILIDPNEPNRLENLTHFALIAYVVYSAIIYVFSRRKRNFPFRAMLLLTWADVVWYSILITLGTGTNAVFFFFYLFAIIAGSSRGGTRLGFVLTVVCTSLFLMLNILLLDQLQLDVPRFARRAVYMAALGYILAYWGGAEARLRRRLTFLKEMSLITNPRLGVDRTIHRMLRRVLEHFESDYAFLVIRCVGGGLDFYRVDANNPESECHPMKLQEDFVIPLMDCRDPSLGVYRQYGVLRWKEARYRACDPDGEVTKSMPAVDPAAASEMIGVRSFITAPLRYHGRIRGRILVGSARPARFQIDDALFLLQSVEQVLPMIENLRLIDRLATDAAEEERRKIARNVHDRVIQPYLGLQIGIKALQQQLSRSAAQNKRGETERSLRVLDELVAMTAEGVQELRQYVNGLKNPPAGETTLVDAIRRFSTRFEGVTGIRVDVINGSCALTMKDGLSAEVFQMTAEALSNIQRHTHARRTEVRLCCTDSNLELSVENDADEIPEPFRPLSIVERAEALGGRTEILWPAGKTLVRVEVPL